jgi:hypothetical protein
MLVFAGNYSKWNDKQMAQAVAKTKATTKTQATAARPQKRANPKSEISNSRSQISNLNSKNPDNPYLRPFGRLSVKELEQQITETEIAIAECQGAFADSDSFKDPERAQKLQNEYKSLSEKLEQLEAEYFARET